MPRERRDADAGERTRRGLPVKDMWMEGSEKTLPLRIRTGAMDEGDLVRAAWIRTMSAKREFDEEQAARLWDSEVSLIPKQAFSAGFHSREDDVEERDLRIAAIEDELREEGRRTEALLAELEERTEHIERLDREGEKVRKLLKALAVLAAASAREEIASDPERMTQIAFSVLSDFSAAVAGDRDASYSSRPVYVGAAAAFRKLREQGDTAELARLHRDLSGLLQDMEPEFLAAEQKTRDEGDRTAGGEPGDDGLQSDE